MTTEKRQSAINEVRDQISLDYADGKYLNNVTANLGMSRPPLGFSDDTWRAVVKSVALQYKQIKTKFADILSIIFGPKVTQVATLAEDVSTGDTSLRLHDASHLPQTGTIILDEGLPSEETVEYSFIDYSSNVVSLETKLTMDHSSLPYDDEQPLVFNASAGDTEIYVPRSIYMPSSFPHTVVLGRGTPSEEVVGITGNNQDTGVLTVSPALSNDHQGFSTSFVQSSLSSDYARSSEFLRLVDSSQFPEEGYVKLAASSNSFTATSGTTTTVTIAVGNITADRHVGNVVVFDGNVTSALAGVEAEIVGNTGTVLTFKSALGAAPSSGDTFSIRPIVRYTRNVYGQNVLNLSRDIPDLTLSSGTEVELLVPNSTAALGTVKVAGSSWDIFQVDPRNVEIYLPEENQDVRDLRSASYVHPEFVTAGLTTLTSAASPGDTSIELSTVADWPVAGQLSIGSEYYGFRKVFLEGTYVASGSTSTTLNFTGDTFAGSLVGGLVYIEDPENGLSISRTIDSFTGTSVTFVEPISSTDLEKLVDGRTIVKTYSSQVLEIPNQIRQSHTSPSFVSYYQIIGVSSAVQKGNLWTEDAVFPGPYVYNALSFSPEGATASTTLTESLSGPTKLSVSQIAGATALEVEDANLYPLASFPQSAIVGDRTGNREQITITDVNLRTRTATTLSSAASPGDTSLLVTSITGSGGEADSFPDANGYRVIVSRGTADEEIVYVRSVSASPDTLNVDAIVNSHASGATVELAADVLTVNPLDDNHQGFVKFSNKLDSLTPVGLTTTTTVDHNPGDLIIEVSSTERLPRIGRLRLGVEEYRYSIASSTSLNILEATGITKYYPSSTTVYVLQSQDIAERVNLLYDEINVLSTTGFTPSGDLLLNFGVGQNLAESTLSFPVSAGATSLILGTSDEFPTSTAGYEVVISPGTAIEERAIVTGNNTATETLSLTSYGTKYAHPVGAKVRLTRSDRSELLNYSDSTSTTFRFSPPIMLESSHVVGEDVVRTTARSIPKRTGYDFPLRLPTDIAFRLKFLIDLVRAAGVQVSVIDKR